MSTRRNNRTSLNKGNRVPKAPPSRRQPIIDRATATGRVVVVETVHAAEDIIRVSIEMARAARQPERIIVF
jgi:hypothetical protein